jgi:hypothetical protein
MYIQAEMGSLVIEYVARALPHWWALMSVGAFFGLDKVASVHWKWLKEKLDRIPQSTRRAFEIAALIIAFFYGGFAAWREEHVALLAMQDRDPDAFYQLGQKVATISGAQPDMPNGRILFYKIIGNDQLNPSHDFEYREWVLHCVDGGQQLPSAKPPPNTVVGYAFPGVAIGFSCDIVRARK